MLLFRPNEPFWVKTRNFDKKIKVHNFNSKRLEVKHSLDMKNTVFPRIVSFLNLTLCSVTFGHSTYRCGNYSRADTIRGNTVFTISPIF